MRNQPLPLITGFYADRSRPFSEQDCCNWLPSVAEVKGTRTEAMCKTPPGLSPLVQFDNVDDPMRGSFVFEGKCFAVAGSTLYQVLPDDTIIVRGTIPGVGPVRAAHNQITGGNEIVFVNGSAGYVWNTADSTFTQITDTGFPGAIDVVYIDGFFVFIEPARRYAFNSDLASALAYNTFDRFTSEVSPDLLVGMAVNNNELVLFSESTTEFFENTGANQQPFRSKRISFQKGCAARYAIAQMDNTVLWFGDDGMYYKLDGYSPKRISPRPIEQAVRGLNWAQAFAFVWEIEGHSVCYWTFPDGHTWGHDVSQPPGLDWHRRESLGLSRWRVNSMAFWQNRWIAGDFQRGRLWELDPDYPLEGADEFVSYIVSPVIHDNQNRVLMPKLELVMDTGQPLVTPRAFPLELTGDLGNGMSGDVESGTYTAFGGTPPYVLFEILSGTFPAGLTLNTDGTWSGTRTTTGTYNWVVQVTDSLGQTATLPDTSITSAAGAVIVLGADQHRGRPADALTFFGSFSSPQGSMCNGVKPMVSNDNTLVVGRDQPNNTLLILAYDVVAGTYTTKTKTGAVPAITGTKNQCIAVTDDGGIVFSLADFNQKVYAFTPSGSDYANTAETTTGVGTTHCVLLSPDRTRLAVAGVGGLEVYTIDDALGALTLESSRVVGNVSWIDWEDRYICAIDGTELIVWDADDGLSVAATLGVTGTALAGWAPGATHVYIGRSSVPYQAQAITFNPTSGILTPGNTYAQSTAAYNGWLTKSRASLAIPVANSFYVYTVNGGTLQDGTEYSHSFSSGYWHLAP